MRENLAQLGLATALMVMLAKAVSGQTTDDPLLGAVEAVAALPGAPSTVSAAGLTPAGQRILTLEGAGWLPTPARRLVIVGGLDGTAESTGAVLEALRWFKTEAPAEVQRSWSITAVPCAYPEQCRTGSTAGGRAPANTPIFPPEGGAVVDVSTSMGAGPTKQYYLDRTAVFGPDDRGGAMALWAAMEMDELR